MPLLPRYLFGRVLSQRMVISASQCIGIANVELLLSRFGLALRSLYRNIHRIQMVAQWPHDALFTRGL